MNVVDHISDSSPSLQPLIGATVDDETIIHFLEVSAQYLNASVGQSPEAAQCRK